ncbi:MAG: hypothetical protein ABSH22_06910 [Tepidisphaeraceae bacterium]|jgi:hypothetical protein
MVLRKCPSCREIVGAESITCPRCGVSFRAASIRRFVIRALSIAIILWGIAHYVFKRI